MWLEFGLAILLVFGLYQSLWLSQLQRRLSEIEEFLKQLAQKVPL